MYVGQDRGGGCTIIMGPGMSCTKDREADAKETRKLKREDKDAVGRGTGHGQERESGRRG